VSALLPALAEHTVASKFSSVVYDRLQAGCYLTINSIFKQLSEPNKFYGKVIERLTTTNVKYLRHSRRLEICEPLKAVEKPWATSKMAAIYLKKFS